MIIDMMYNIANVLNLNGVPYALSGYPAAYITLGQRLGPEPNIIYIDGDIRVPCTIRDYFKVPSCYTNDDGITNMVVRNDSGERYYVDVLANHSARTFYADKLFEEISTYSPGRLCDYAAIDYINNRINSSNLFAIALHIPYYYTHADELNPISAEVYAKYESDISRVFNECDLKYESDKLEDFYNTLHYRESNNNVWS